MPSWDDPTHVVPAQGSKLVPYNPFEEHDKYWGGRSRIDGQPPYVELANLDLDDPTEILRWCSRHGLLGILPHRTLEARLWPRWEREALSGLLVPQGQQYVQGVPLRDERTLLTVPTLWIDVGTGRVVHQREYTKQAEDPSAGEPLTADELAEVPNFIRQQWGLEAKVRIRNAEAGTIEDLDVIEGYVQFFPYYEGVSDWVQRRYGAEKPPKAEQTAARMASELASKEYPALGSEKFQREYGEPIELFRRYATWVREALELWEQLRAASSPDEVQRIRSQFDPLQGQFGRVHFDRFQLALATVHPTVRPEGNGNGGNWSHAWHYPSLFAALHLMIYQDFPLAERFVKRCQKKGCGKSFVTNTDTQRYCSQRCKWAAKKDRYRATRRADPNA